MRKIFILTGEPSGDRLAAKIISRLKKVNPEIEYLSVGGEHLKAQGINSLYNMQEITYLGFTKVLFNFIKIKRKINITANKIIEFNPDILFSVDSPDFTLRVSELVKKKNNNIKTIHYVAPQVWIWREGRTKKIKNFIDHMLLLFRFEKKYFDKENIKTTFVGHPLLEKKDNKKINLDSIIDINKKIISIFPGSRKSEIITLMPILLKFVKISSEKYKNFTFVFHSTKDFKNIINNLIIQANLKNCEVISDELVKNSVLQRSFFAITKSGTISLEVCNANIPSIIIYKMNFINYLIIKLLVKVKFANIINIINKAEIIPELLQSKCNSYNIYKKFIFFVENPHERDKQIQQYKKIVEDFKSVENSSDKVSAILNESLKAFNS